MVLHNSLKNKKVLITCGPTWVPLDDTRVISNKSTGELGHLIAKECQKQKARVTLLLGPVPNIFSVKNLKVLKFSYYNELLNLIKRELKGKYAVVIHAAAVADYQLKKPFARKIHSNHPRLKLTLIRTQKIIQLIKKIDPKVCLVGFKLESKLSPALAQKKARDLMIHSNSDLVIVNSTQNKKYEGYIIDNRGNIITRQKTRLGIAQKLVNILTDKP